MTLAVAVACGPSSHDEGRGPREPAETGAGGSSGAATDGGAHATDGGIVATDGGTLPDLPWDNVAFPSVVDPDDNPSTPEKIALGRLLFYDPMTSVDHQVACATCHSEIWGMSDGLARSVGHGAGLLAGPGRNGPNVTRRNAPTLWNVGFRANEFWDGRAASLEDQVHFPFDTAEELDTTLDDVTAAVAAIPAYATLFAEAFPDEANPVMPVTFARAVAAFERSLLSHRGLYDAYVAGDRAALTDDMLHGMSLLATEGCTNCHVPPLFSSERFVDRGVAPVPGVDDAGRFEVTKDEADRNAFKVPTLRNAHDTGPYFHTGGVSDFDQAVREEVAFSVAHDGAPALSDSDTSDLSAFIMKGLFDSQDSPTRPKEVPSGLPVPVDGFSIRR
ncbi:MAG TPA: cytochrome c peroxidase [Polyangiaceae bacterium]|nr:cytochrome c peroxidase [Polyangiaceae bacterium]